MAEILPEDVHKILEKYMLVDGYDLVLDLRKSKGSWVYDAKRGCYFLDFFTFFASSPIGYNHPKLTETEFIRKLGEVAVNKPANSDLYTVEMAEFVDTFTRVAVPEYMKYLFFVSGGALAVENGLKVAMDWKVRKNFSKGLREEKGHQVIHFEEAFHGRSGYTLSLTNTFDPRKTKYFAKFDWPRIINPKITFPLNDENLRKVKELEETAIEQINNAIAERGDDICSLIIEPIQGEGGDNHFRAEFFKQLRKICDENELMFIVDEVQAGVGLTGKMWAYQHYGIKPDIIAFGKKTQVCGIMVGSLVDEVDNHVFKESSRINSTWGGNLIDMVRATKYFEIIEEERLVENAAKMGDYLQKRLHELGDNYPEIISNIRGKGLMCAFDLPDSKTRDMVKDTVYKNLMIVLPCGEKSIRFRPALNINRDEIDRGIEILDNSIKEVVSRKKN